MLDNYRSRVATAWVRNVVVIGTRTQVSAPLCHSAVDMIGEDGDRHDAKHACDGLDDGCNLASHRNCSRSRRCGAP